MAEIDSLSISIKADAKTAGNAIDDLVNKLTGLTVALGKIDGNDKLSGFSQGVQAFATAMQGFKGIGTEKFNAITTGLTNLSNLNAQGLNTVSGSITNISNSLGILSRIQFDNKNIQSLINSLTRMAKADISELSKVDFTSLGNSLNNLATSLQNAPKIEQSVIAMTKAITSLSKYGGNMPVVASSLGALGNSLTMFMSTMANAPRITDSALAFTQAISSLAGAGAKAGVTASNLSALGVGIKNIMTTLSTAPKVSRNVIDMTNALANLSAQGSKVGSASRNMVYGLNRTSRSADRAKKSFSGLASVIGKFYANYFLVVRGFKALWRSIGSTSDYVESFNYYTVSFGKIASKWDKEWKNYGDENARNYSNAFVTTMNDTLKKMSGVSYNPKTGLLSETGLKNLGLNIQEVTNYAAQLASMMDSIGQNGEVTLATTKAFVKLAGDISSLKNIDYSDAANKIQSVLMGQSRAGYSLGWDTTMASLQATADSLNLSKSVSEMAQFEKQQLRILTILEQSRVAWGDQSNTINTLSNQIRLFRNNIKEAGLLVGQLFTPIMVNLMPVINGVTIALKRMLSYLGIALGANMKDVSQGFNDMEDGAFDMSEEIDGATESLKKYKNQAMDFDEINPIKGVDDSANLGNLTGGSIDLTDEILQATKEYEKAWQESYDNMESRSQEIANRIVNGFKNAFKNAGWYGVGNYISSGIADSLANADFDSVHKGLENVARNIANFLNGLITPDLLGNVGKSFAKSLNAVINAKATLGENIDFKQVGDSIATGINNFFDTFDFERLGESINTWVKGLGTALVEAVKEIDWSDVIKGLGELITELDTETLAILGGLGLLRSGGLKSLIFGNGINLGGAGAGGVGGITTGGFNLNSLLFGKNLGGGISFGNAGLFGTLALGLGAGSIGTDIGRVLGAAIFGDSDLYLNYDVKDATLYIANALMKDPEEVKNAVNNMVSDWGQPVVDWINKIIGSGGEIDDKEKQLFPWIDDFLEYYGLKKPEETKPETKPVGLETFVTGLDISKLKKYEKFFPFLSLVASQETSKNPSSLINENVFSQVGDWDTFMSSVYDELSVKMSVKWQLGGREIDFLGIGEEMKKQGASMAWNIGQGILNDKSSKSAISILAQGLKDVLGGKSGSIIEFAKSFGVNVVKNLGVGLQNNTYAKTALDNVLNNVKSVFGNNSLIDTAIAKGKSIVWNLGNGMAINQSTATSAMQKIFNSIGNVASSTTITDKFKTAGKNIIQGLIGGLNDKTSLSNLATTVAGLGKSVAGIFTGVLDIHSPSRLFEKYAMYTIQGYNIGLEKYAPTTLDSMEDWSSSIANANMSMEYPSVSANSEELLLLRQQNMLLQALLNKETVEIKGDAKQIFKVVQKQANNYTIQTGEPAFAF